MTPNTAKKLNTWIESAFSTLYGPARAWIEIPIKIWVGNTGQGQASTEFYHRVVFKTLALKGREEDCCTEIYKDLFNVPLHRERLQDGVELLFIRTPFQYNREEGDLHGRLAFWDPLLNIRLGNVRSCIEQGTMPRHALKPGEEDDQHSTS